jgi:ketopantoate reductase
VGSVLELARVTGTPVLTIEALYAVVKLLEATLASQGSMLRLQPRGI